MKISTLFGDEEVKTKECSKCSKELPLSDFTPASGGKYLRSECKVCNNKLSKERKELRKTVTPPPDDYVCPICLGTEDEVKHRGGKKNGAWCLDHNHKTGEVRGWLCHSCNRSIGSTLDDIESMKRALTWVILDGKF